MKIGLLGCGAMGSLYGGYLTRAHEVYVCDVWKEHIEAIRAEGIRLEEPSGETAVFRPAFATTDPSEIGPVDVMIVFVKYMLLEEALKNARTMIGPETIVLSLQNGIGNYDEIAKVVPERQICCGTTAHGCTFLEPGRVRHTGVGITNVGTLKGDMASAEKVAGALRQGGFEAAVHENVMELIWHKLFANIAINAVTALLDQPNATVAENPHERALAEKMVREAVAVANAAGCHFDPESELRSAMDVALATGTNRSSMLQDVTRQRETEIKIINGAVVRTGLEAGIPTPYNEAICHLIQAKQSFYLNK
ncbi:MAG: 2-dehydropantoate 2-reductase [Oscillibacter sp.]|nr:2-dehydropantoate 2-reductase [Oscillibacter sp.]